jgi:hypothetical protein
MNAGLKFDGGISAGTLVSAITTAPERYLALAKDSTLTRSVQAIGSILPLGGPRRVAPSLRPDLISDSDSRT